MTPAKASFTSSLTRTPRLENNLGHFDEFAALRLSVRYWSGTRPSPQLHANRQDAQLSRREPAKD